MKCRFCSEPAIVRDVDLCDGCYSLRIKVGPGHEPPWWFAIVLGVLLGLFMSAVVVWVTS